MIRRGSVRPGSTGGGDPDGCSGAGAWVSQDGTDSGDGENAPGSDHADAEDVDGSYARIERAQAWASQNASIESFGRAWSEFLTGLVPVLDADGHVMATVKASLD
jgi:hypothetical protein